MKHIQEFKKKYILGYVFMHLFSGACKKFTKKMTNATMTTNIITKTF
jgi:hypothetical protein